jgi:hypothetical protein
LVCEDNWLADGLSNEQSNSSARFDDCAIDGETIALWLVEPAEFSLFDSELHRADDAAVDDWRSTWKIERPVWHSLIGMYGPTVDEARRGGVGRVANELTGSDVTALDRRFLGNVDPPEFHSCRTVGDEEDDEESDWRVDDKSIGSVKVWLLQYDEVIERWLGAEQPADDIGIEREVKFELFDDEDTSKGMLLTGNASFCTRKWHTAQRAWTHRFRSDRVGAPRKYVRFRVWMLNSDSSGRAGSWLMSTWRHWSKSTLPFSFLYDWSV